MAGRVQLIWRLASYVRPELPAYLLAVLCMALLAAATGAEAWLIGPVVRFLVGAGGGAEDASATLLQSMPFLRELDFVQGLLTSPQAGFTLLPIVLIVVASAKAVAFFGQATLMGRVSNGAVHRLRVALFEHTLRLSLAFYDRAERGQLTSCFVSDVAATEGTISFAFANLLRDFLQAVVLAGLAISLDAELALVTVLALPLAVYPIARFGRAARRISRRIHETHGDLTQRLSEVFGAMRVVQGFGREQTELGSFTAASRQHMGQRIRAIMVRAVASPAMELLGAVLLAVTLMYAGRRIASGDLAPEAFLSFFGATFLMYRPLKSLSRVYQVLQQGLAAAQRIFELMDTQPEVQSAPDAPALPVLAEKLSYDQVGFAYAGGPPALDDVSFTLERGRMLAIVGPSGGGKSTLASLLPRFYDPVTGCVRIDGQDIRGGSLESLRRQIGIVSQDPVLFNDSLRANIAYGAPEGVAVEDAAIWAAAEAAHAAEFIREMPEGLETEVGDRGVRLSGGQRQRISIARALLRDPAILVLDEATSSLDAQSEREVQAALDTLMQTRTTLVIAHRLSTVRQADEIIVVSGGRIVERGTHASLIDAGGEYARLFALQAG